MPPPETRSIPVKEMSVEQQAFQQAKTRIEKSQRIKADLKDLKTGQPKSANHLQRVQEIRDVEAKSEQGQAGSEKGAEELVIDNRGYQEQRIKVNYKSPDGKVVSEELVMFVKLGTSGQPEFLRDPIGKVWALNADLYDSRLTSNIHPKGLDYQRTVIPRIEGRGAYSGVVSLVEDDKPIQRSSNPDTDDSPQAKVARAFQQARQAESTQDYLTRISEASARGDKAALQAAILEARVGDKVSRTDVTALLERLGIPYEKRVSDDVSSSLRPIFDKLSAFLRPGVPPILGGGIEITPGEFETLMSSIDRINKVVESLPAYQNLRKLQQQAMQDRGYAASYNGIIEDATLTEPQIVQIPNLGLRIKAPPEVAAMDKYLAQIHSFQSNLQAYPEHQKNPDFKFGIRIDQLINTLNNGVTILEKANK